MIKTAGNTNRKLELLQRLITGNNWEVLEERYLACFLMPCVCHELYCLPLSALPPQQLESGAEQGPQKAPSAFAAANRYWVRLALAAAAFLFPWPVSQTRSGLPRVQPIEASILTLRTWASIRTRGKRRTDRDRGASRSPRGGGPHLHANPTHPPLNQTVSPGPLMQTLDHLFTPGSVDAGASERDEGLK